MKFRSSLLVLLVLALSEVQGKEEERNRAEVRYVEALIKRINGLCGSQGPPLSCGCDKISGYTLAFPVRQIFWDIPRVYNCHPNYCKCPNGTDVDSRPKELRKIIQLCPKGQLESCTCAADNKTIPFPFDLRTVFYDCRPAKCQCKNDPVEKVVTHFGCSKGGIAYCKDNQDWWCENNTFLVDRNIFLHAKLDNKCMCRDGLKPRCRSTGGFPTCPGGEEIDYSIGQPDPAFRLCK